MKTKKISPKISYNDHALRVLEFNRVCDIIASLAQSGEGRDSLAATIPCQNIEAARRLLAEVGECMDALRYDDPLPAIDIHDIRDIFPLLKIKQ